MVTRSRHKTTRRSHRRSDELLFVPAIIVIVIGGVGSSGSSSRVLVIVVLFAALVAVGILATLFLRLSRERMALRKLTPANIDSLPGIAFERWVAEQLRIRGYRVHRTPINDYGVDIVVVKEGVRTAVQVKRYTRPLDQKPIREAVAGMIVYRCTASMVVTNSTFTPAARKLAADNHCKLIDRTKPAQWFNAA